MPFLDALVQRHGDGKLNTGVYRKSSTSDIILHYGSNHPTNHKRLCVKTMFDRARLCCSDRTTLTLELYCLLNMFRNCGYPPPFIRRSMRPQTEGKLNPRSAAEGPLDQPGQPTAMSNSSLHQRHLRDTSPTPTEATTSKWHTSLPPPSELPW